LGLSPPEGISAQALSCSNISTEFFSLTDSAKTLLNFCLGGIDVKHVFTCVNESLRYRLDAHDGDECRHPASSANEWRDDGCQALDKIASGESQLVVDAVKN
jgi:hypothetical protein